MKKINQKGFSIVEGLVIILVILAIATLGWIVYNRMQDNKDQTNSVTQAEGSATTPIATTGTAPAAPKNQTYKDSKSKITFNYPSGWKVVTALPSLYKTDYSMASSTWASPIAECSGPFLVNESDAKQIITIDISDSDGEGGYCYSWGSFSEPPKWNSGDNWEGSYFVDSEISKKSGNKYGYVFLFNYKTDKLLGKDVLTQVADSFNFY